ncbi:MAG: NAD(P)-dependent oxidoreductase [Clostridia bacterium]
MKKILLPNPLPLEWLSPYAAEYAFTTSDHHLNKKEIIAQIPEYDVFFTIYCPVDEEILLAGNKLKIVNTFGVGYNHIDIIAAKQLGIKVCNCPNAVTVSTAELGMGMIFNLLRRITEADRRMRAGDRTIWGALGLTGTNLLGKKLGIIGFGRIGQKIASYASIFGMEIFYYNRSNKIDEAKKTAATYLPLDQLLASCDCILLSVSLSETTTRMISERELALMKSTAFLINIARGAVVDEKALLLALQQKTIAGAGLDVFISEPDINESFLSLDNVVLTPHIGTETIATNHAVFTEAMTNVQDFFHGIKLQNLVNP